MTEIGSINFKRLHPEEDGLTIKRLIEILQQNEYPETTKIVAWDADTAKLQNVTGFIYDSRDGILEICTDDPR